MADEALSKALFRAQLALRITLGLFLLQWGVEKFVVPQSNVFIWSLLRAGTISTGRDKGN